MWGRQGYLVQTEPVEESDLVEVTGPLQSPNQQAGADGPPSQTPTLKPTPQPEQEKQQLASSLFVGLGSQSSLCLVSF